MFDSVEIRVGLDGSIETVIPMNGTEWDGTEIPDVILEAIRVDDEFAPREGF